MVEPVERRHADRHAAGEHAHQRFVQRDVTDSLGAFTNGSFTLPVLATPGLFFQTTSPLPPGTPNLAYSTVVQVGGGNGVYTLSPPGCQPG